MSDRQIMPEGDQPEDQIYPHEPAIDREQAPRAKTKKMSRRSRPADPDPKRKEILQHQREADRVRKQAERALDRYDREQGRVAAPSTERSSGDRRLPPLPDPDPVREQLLVTKRKAVEGRKKWDAKLRTYDRKLRKQHQRELRARFYTLGEALWRSKGCELHDREIVRLVARWIEDERVRDRFALLGRGWRSLQCGFYIIGEALWRSKHERMNNRALIELVNEYIEDPADRARFGIPPRPSVQPNTPNDPDPRSK